MNARKDGGPAFPRNGHPDKNDFPQDGMTLRDHFAGQALAAFCANPATSELYRDDPWPEVRERLAQAAYEVADAMIAARDA